MQPKRTGNAGIGPLPLPFMTWSSQKAAACCTKRRYKYVQTTSNNCPWLFLTSLKALTICAKPSFILGSSIDASFSTHSCAEGRWSASLCQKLGRKSRSSHVPTDESRDGRGSLPVRHPRPMTQSSILTYFCPWAHTIELCKRTSMVVPTPRLNCQCQKFGNLHWSFDFCHCHCRKLPQNKQKSQVLLLSGQNVVFSRIYVLTACDVAMDIIASKRKRSSRPSM